MKLDLEQSKSGPRIIISDPRARLALSINAWPSNPNNALPKFTYRIDLIFQEGWQFNLLDAFIHALNRTLVPSAADTLIS